MGYGNYDQQAHEALTSKRVDLPTEQVFTQRGCHPDMNPFGVSVRESRDSSNHPESTAIIFALDVSGSMGDIPALLAKRELPGFMEQIIEGEYIRDPQLMFMAVFDANARDSQRPPLQVGQFESEAELMDQWLTRMYLTGGGGPINGESYELAAYFAARHTAMDCWEKRGRKGYLILTGDEPHFGTMPAEHASRVFGDKLKGPLRVKEIFDEAAEKFHVFFLIPDLNRRANCEREWREILGDRVICMESYEDTCLVSATLIGLTEGTLPNLEAAGDTLKKLGVKRAQIDRVIRAVEPYAAVVGASGPERPPEKAPVPRRGKKDRL